LSGATAGSFRSRYRYKEQLVGIRETLNKNQNITTIGTIVIIVIAIGVIVWQLMPPSMPNIVSKSYYSVDDGKSYFEAPADKIVPYDHEGKEAVRAHVFQCGSEPPFVGYLEKLDPKVKAKLDEFHADPKNKGKVMPGQFEEEENGRLVKRPGDKTWIPDTHPAAARVTTIKCKDGSYAIRLTPDMPK
jgi:hypothetical protein